MTSIKKAMTNPTANFPGDPTRSQAAPGDFDETEISTGTLEAHFEIGSESDRLESIYIGQELDDFDLLVELGSGAFARVFLARQRSLQRLVAVKVSLNRGNEPQTLAQLDHDNIVRVFDQRILPERDWRLLYMQYIPGGTLLNVVHAIRNSTTPLDSGRALLAVVDEGLEGRGEIRPADSPVRAEVESLSWPETVAWLGKRLAEALHYANSRGVLHRDIKPANVLLAPDGTPKLADFNISFARNVEGASPLSYFGGSLAYMSPEQIKACRPGHTAEAADLDTRSDIFSLAVMLWELLTRQKPFDDSSAAAGGDDSALEQMLSVRGDGISAAAIAALPANCPSALRRVLTKALSRSPDDRWSTGAEFAEQLQLCLDPRARDLVDPPPNSWRLKLRPLLMPVGVFAVGLPNLLASAYNIQHNQMLIVSQLTADAQTRFILVTTLLNLVMFPLGFGVMVYWCRHVILVPRRLRRGDALPPASLKLARQDCLAAGYRVVLVGFCLWLSAGVTLPLSLEFAAGGLSVRSFFHFIASLSVCGAIALAYPFFLLTFYLVRCVYPELIATGIVTPDEYLDLQQLQRRLPRFLAVAAAVPLLGVLGVSFLNAGEIASVIMAVRILCVGSIAAFVLSYWLSRLIESDIQALARVVLLRARLSAPTSVPTRA